MLDLKVKRTNMGTNMGTNMRALQSSGIDERSSIQGCSSRSR